MENKDFVVKSNLGVVEYAMLVDNIASGFFDEEGTYTPHFGKINAMGVFYNSCVVDSKFNIEHNIVDALDMDVLVEDEEFITAFNNAVKGDGAIRLDFSNAYADAMKIVKTKKSSVGSLLGTVRNMLLELVETFKPELEKLDMDKLMKIADDLSNGAISADAIVEAYGNSKTLQDTLNTEK